VSLKPVEARFVRAINSYRAEHDLPPLEPHPVLVRVARARVTHLDAARPGDDPTHNHRALGMWCWHHAHRAGFGGWATDNLAMGCLSPQEAVDAWAAEDNDPVPAGHNYQMRGQFRINGRWRNYRFNRVGVAVSGKRFIAIFGRLD